MVTRGHLFPARFAIDGYRRQTWPRRELVIVCDEPASELHAHVDALSDNTIRILQAEPASLGALRNFSLAAARGALVAQWDDDDLYHPQRLEMQAKALIDHPKAAAHFLSRWYLWWPARRTLAVSGQRMWEGSMLAHRHLVPPYPPQALREDSEAVETLLKSRKAVHSDAPSLYCYVVHGGNSWDKAHFEKMFGMASETFEDEAYEAERARLGQILPLDDYEQAWADARR